MVEEDEADQGEGTGQCQQDHLDVIEPQESIGFYPTVSLEFAQLLPSLIRMIAVLLVLLWIEIFGEIINLHPLMYCKQ